MRCYCNQFSLRRREKPRAAKPKPTSISDAGSGAALALMLSKSYAVAELLKTICALVNGVLLPMPANPTATGGSGDPVKSRVPRCLPH